jgi:hypothetical protein
MTRSSQAFKPSNEIPAGPSAWELFLLSVGVSEKYCAALLSGRTQKGRAIRTWVQENYVKRFVPEYVLQAVGLHKRLAIRWLGED